MTTKLNDGKIMMLVLTLAFILNAASHRIYADALDDQRDFGSVENRSPKSRRRIGRIHSANGSHHVYNLTKIQAEAKDHRAPYEERSPLPIVVRGDERKLPQILLNLSGNGVKYTERGSVIFRVGPLPPAPPFKGRGLG